MSGRTKVEEKQVRNKKNWELVKNIKKKHQGTNEHSMLAGEAVKEDLKSRRILLIINNNEAYEV